MNPLLSASTFVVLHSSTLQSLIDMRQTFWHNWFSLLLEGLICSILVTRIAGNTAFDDMQIVTFASLPFVLFLMSALALPILSTVNSGCLVSNLEIPICQAAVSFTTSFSSSFFSLPRHVVSWMKRRWYSWHIQLNSLQVSTFEFLTDVWNFIF